jgi:hypothetical protein
MVHLVLAYGGRDCRGRCSLVYRIGGSSESALVFMRTTWPKKPHAANPAMPFLLHAGHHRRGVADGGRCPRFERGGRVGGANFCWRAGLGWVEADSGRWPARLPAASIGHGSCDAGCSSRREEALIFYPPVPQRKSEPPHGRVVQLGSADLQSPVSTRTFRARLHPQRPLSTLSS